MTAVEWLGNEWLYLDQQFDMCLIDRNIYWDKLRQIQEQAKKMEKKIIAQAFEDGDYNYFYNHQNGREFLNGIEYYNQKFKSE